MLLFKAGRHDEAIETLWRVRDLCRVTHDRFYEEKVYLALGHALHGSGRTAEALDAYREGARISVDMRTPDAYADHARGALVCLAAAGDGAGFERLVAQLAGMEPTAAIAEAIRGAPADLAPAERLAAAGVRPPVPSPKMPAYIPSVDLEGAPARDLNRYLVSEGGPFQ